MDRPKKSTMTLEDFFKEYKKLFKLGWLAYRGVAEREAKPIWLAPPVGTTYRLPDYRQVGIFDPITAVCVVKTGELFSIAFPRNAARILGLSRPDRENLIEEGDGLRCGEMRQRLLDLSIFDESHRLATSRRPP